MKKTILLLLLLTGCASPRKECNLELIRQRHPAALREAMEEHPALIMDFMHTIAVLEKENGGYR